EPGHDVEIFDAHLGASFAYTVEHRHDHKAVALFVNVDSDVAIVGARDRAHPRIRFIVPGFVLSAWLIVDFDKGLAGIELPEEVQCPTAIEPFQWEAAADVNDYSNNGNVAGGEVHSDRPLSQSRQFLFHLVGMPVTHDVVQHDVAIDFGMMNRSREICSGSSGS